MAHLGRPAASIPPSLRAPERRTAIQCWRKPSWIASLALAMTVEGVIVIIPCLNLHFQSSKISSFLCPELLTASHREALHFCQCRSEV